MEVLLFNLSLNLPSLALQDQRTERGASCEHDICPLTSYTRRFNSKAQFDMTSLCTTNVLAGFTVNECRQKLLRLHPGRSQNIDNTLEKAKSSEK